MEPVGGTEAAFRALAADGDNREIEELVRGWGERARVIVPECVGLSVGMVKDGLTFTLVATDQQVGALDAMQYLDGGPCVEAEDRAAEVSVLGVLSKDRWLM